LGFFYARLINFYRQSDKKHQSSGAPNRMNSIKKQTKAQKNGNLKLYIASLPGIYIRVVRKLQFPNNFLIKKHFLGL
jgi:hypothetical protein